MCRFFIAYRRYGRDLWLWSVEGLAAHVAARQSRRKAATWAALNQPKLDMPEAAELAAVVLAGGASRRMGRDKAGMPHPRHLSMTMLEHTVSVLSARCAPVFVVAAPGQVLPDLTNTADTRVLRDDASGIGPLLATGRGLRAAAAAGADRAFVSAVDMPNLGADIVEALAGHIAESPADADIVLAWDGRDHYLAGVYRTALADRIDALVGSGERRMRALADTVTTRRVVLARPAALVNLNTPADQH